MTEQLTLKIKEKKDFLKTLEATYQRLAKEGKTLQQVTPFYNQIKQARIEIERLEQLNIQEL